MKKNIVPILLIAALMLVSCTQGKATDSGLFVEKVPDLPADFYMGADVSSVIALEKSGVVFRDKAGKPHDIFDTLRQSGVTCVRIRVWNDPFDESGNGFGGGNNDINTAIEIGKRAKKAKLGVYLDFHYSDFWADPSKQMVPRAWKDMDIDEKADALYAYTVESLEKVKSAGIQPVILQIGNETTGTFCGENNWLKITKLFTKASEAMCAVFPKAKIAVHFTNPEKTGEYERYAAILERYKVDYDIFASSYYPYWHGTLENLTSELAGIREKYGKDIMCAETSYMYTYENGDENGNTISEETVCDKPYPPTVQGQANEVRDVIAAVNAAGGIGVFYWEPAWIGVPGSTWEEQSALWEKYGSGWASSYAGVYDPDDAGIYYGGSSWDNQAMFDFEGRPLDSLSVFSLVRTGATTSVRPDTLTMETVKVRLKDTYTLPETVEVLYNDSTTERAAVTWNSVTRTGEKLEELPFMGPAVHFVEGSIEGSVKVALCQIQVVEKNYVDNPSFEEKDISMWEITNNGNVTTELYVQDKLSDAYSGSKALHFWSSGKVSFSVQQTVKDLQPGTYKYSIIIHGGDAKNADMKIFAIADGIRYEMMTKVDGWRNFFNPCINEITLAGNEITIGAEINCDPNGWGSLDEFILAPVED